MSHLVSARRDFVESPELIASFVEDLARQYFADSPDRRSEPRYRMTLPVRVQPLDAQMRAVGDEFRAVTRDISAHGIGLVCQDPTAARYLMLQLETTTLEPITVAVEVLRCQPVGFYYDIGGRFVTTSA